MKYVATVKYPPFLTSYGTGDTLEEALGMLGDALDGLIEDAGTEASPAMQAELAQATKLARVGGALTLEVFKDHALTEKVTKGKP